MSHHSLTTIASFSFPHEAHIAKASLEAAGIPAFLADEHTINMQWLYSNALGGIRLQVPSTCAEAARELLSHNFSESLAEEIGVEQTVCPKCGSNEVEPYTQGKRPAFIIFLLLGFPLFFHRHGIRCKACGQFSAI